MRKADYRQIAETYDAARRLLEENLDLWIDLVSQKIGSIHEAEFLDLGCGTGRFSIPIAARLGHHVTGIDISKEMLLKGKEKDARSQVEWIVENAASLSHPDGSFDAVFMSHLLHHVDEPLKVVEECFRILRPEGMILNRYGAIEDICDDPEHRFFPQTVEIDEARIPTKEQAEKWFGDVGFSRVSSRTIVQQSYESAEERLERVKLKSTSVLTLISESAFEQGLEALREYISDNPNDPWLLMDRITITTGRKPSREE